MRIVINLDPIREGGKRLRIRTRYQTGSRDWKQHLAVRNALVDFYNQIVETIKEGSDQTITEFVDEGERI